MEAALTGSSLKEEHRALIGAALQGFWSSEAGMHEAFKGLITSFEVIFLSLRERGSSLLRFTLLILVTV
jgi:hypothetical protein